MDSTRPLFTRRRVLIGATAICAASAAGLWHLTHPQAAETTRQLNVAEAHAAATSGEILLIDVRRPDEWARTGIGAGARPLDMRRDDFVAALAALAAGDRTRPVAVICARGVRSARMTKVLTEAGFTDLYDVPEGMLGSLAGPGWLGAGLPVVAPE